MASVLVDLPGAGLMVAAWIPLILAVAFTVALVLLARQARRFRVLAEEHAQLRAGTDMLLAAQKIGSRKTATAQPAITSRPAMISQATTGAQIRQSTAAAPAL